MKHHIYAEIVVKDKKGVSTRRRYKCNTYVKNFMMLQNAAFNIGAATVTQTNGASASAGALCYGLYIICYGGWSPTAPQGDASYGIHIGTSDVGVSINDYNLGAQIAHGNGAGQLYHYPTTLLDPAVDGNTVTQKISRGFMNNSGAEITVKEIGLVVKTNYFNLLVMIIRDVITPLPIPDGGNATIDVLLKTTA